MNGGLLMGDSKEWENMLEDAIKQHPLEFQKFDKTKNLQDQIQEMLGDSPAFALAQDLGAWLNYTFGELVENVFDYSMEQLWLAFYMFENHQKIWDSKKETWIKSEQE